MITDESKYMAWLWQQFHGKVFTLGNVVHCIDREKDEVVRQFWQHDSASIKTIKKALGKYLNQRIELVYAVDAGCMVMLTVSGKLKPIDEDINKMYSLQIALEDIQD